MQSTESETFRNRKTPGNGHVSTALINAYLDNRLTIPEKKDFEAALSSNTALQQMLLIKRDEKEFILALIPHVKLPNDIKASLQSEIRDVNKSILKEETPSLFSKVKSLLDTTIVEF